jgi:TonB family protein
MPRFASEGMLVQVDVKATYPNGREIAGLTANDLAVSEDGVPQSIKVFESQQANGEPSYYVLGYYTADSNLDGRYRKIEITLPGNPTAKIDCRAGYSTLVQPPSVAPPTPGPGVTFPTLQHKVEPTYSEVARKRKFQGTVVLQITVNADGTVGDMHVLRSLGLGLDEEAIEAVKQWKFTPGTQNLVAVPMQALVEVNFRLQ